jgi:hypothetical protein
MITLVRPATIHSHSKMKIMFYLLQAEGLLDLHTEMGPIFNLRLGWSDRIATTVPEHIQRLLATEVDNFNKGEFLFSAPFFSSSN